MKMKFINATFLSMVGAFILLLAYGGYEFSKFYNLIELNNHGKQYPCIILSYSYGKYGSSIRYEFIVNGKTLQHDINSMKGSVRENEKSVVLYDEKSGTSYLKSNIVFDEFVALCLSIISSVFSLFGLFRIFMNVLRNNPK